MDMKETFMKEDRNKPNPNYVPAKDGDQISAGFDERGMFREFKDGNGVRREYEDAQMNKIVPITRQEIYPVEFPRSVLDRIQEAKTRFYEKSGHQPTKIFMSLDLVTEILIEVLPGARSITSKPGAKNEILGMEIYRVIEPNVLECGY